MPTDPVAVVAARLRLPPARDGINDPWRYWILKYLAALAEQADFEGQPFGRAEARAALDMLVRDAEDLLLLMRATPRRHTR